MSHELFNQMNIEQILDHYRNKTLSPIEVTQFYLNRIESLDPKFHAWTCSNPEMLLNQAAAIEQRLDSGGSIRELEGIPIGVKDIFNTIDFPTEMGSPLWQGFTPGNDARVVYQLRMLGAAIFGKTVTAEFAVHTLGKTKNPYDITRNPGTSSSGSAVAVALGMVPAALGTQTAGSIVRPASYCGVYGCKPSFGLIPRTAMLKTTDSLDTVGFFVKHAHDLDRLWNSVIVHGDNYPISHAALNDKVRQNKPSGRPWKIAIPRTHVLQYVKPYAKNALNAWISKLGQLKDVEIAEVDLPSGMEFTHEIHATIYDKSLAYYFQEEFKKSELVSTIMNQLIVNGNKISPDQHQKAIKEQEVLCKKMDDFMQSYDVMITLSTVGEAPLRDEAELPDSALMWTMTHLPVVSAPVFTSPDGLPLGMQLIARRYNDPLLFKFISFLRSEKLIPETSYSQLMLM